MLGVRLLTLDATIVLAPAEISSASGARTTAGPEARAGTAPRAAGPRPRSSGRALAEAVRAIDEGAALLADARRGGRAAGTAPQ